ncbi:transcription antitermination factor NusG [Lysobacter enzymogenes]|uniref:Transcriptional antiterminator n=1 Tax=Lysobacter enzymogenes TaxID=69 RepID=A0AAU9AHF8_LYSEN|nr:UpxY family transcription antiterminator [Lysobacter enzymogenes]MBN7138604.1 hypothetical protein [Lysobacter enzymogenes]BAV98069.1 transcriptional antiterminator [Lysobacter enzymogenes]SDX40604.1 Transcription antitermination factor NusG [Lysobacter enzymogenes]
MSESSSEPWLVLRTRCRHENVVEDSLQQKSIKAYLPRRSVVTRRQDKKAVVEMPLFPGYVFVQPSPEQYENIRYIRGSCGLVLQGTKPATMPEGDLQAVKRMVESGATLEVAPRVMPGQRVEVIAGPFAGVCGELVRVRSQEHLVINAHMLGSCVSVEVDADAIAAL